MLSIKPVSHVATMTLMLGFIFVSGCGKKDVPPPAPSAQAVTVVTLVPQDVSLTRELVGRTSPFLIAEVRPQVSGIVKQRLFTEGGLVKAGQPLYQLDDATYRANQANTQALLVRAQATAKSAELNARRSAELVQIDAVSQQDNENAAAVLAQARADVTAAQAALQANQVTLNFARIVAPISGRIGKSSVTQGALVTADQTAALATVQQLDPLYVDLTQSSSELLQLRKELAAGTLTRSHDVPVKILLEDGSRYSHDGKLTFTDVTVDPSTGSFGLRVSVPNPDNILLPGMYVRAVVGSGVRHNALLVPQQGVIREPQGDTKAWVVDKSNKAELRRVGTSRTVGNQWLIDSGLAAGDRVIVEGLQKIGPGAPVAPTEAVPADKTPVAAGATVTVAKP
ncbi:MAG: efflux RND transporter periplasmic adaptor subunit [Herbaspirillum sp.]